ncbi:hypothetical protein OKW96_20830 [Sphingobacterium sp. KU25419]|nr:hypothetical protein OKW96_20830 [Sphingobacterium sp. KU25419]
MEKALRQHALDQIFGKMRKGKSGNHKPIIKGGVTKIWVTLEVINMETA